MVTADAPDEDEPDESLDDEPFEPFELLEPESPDDDPLEPVSVDEEPLEPVSVEVEPLEPEELSLEDPLVVAGVALEVAAVLGFAWVVVALVLVFLAPSAGSFPATRRPKIATHTARKTVSVMAMTRRRMLRARCLRARTRWRASPRASSGVMGGGVESGVVMAGSMPPRRESAVDPS